jgi:hypothetical protein
MKLKVKDRLKAVKSTVFLYITLVLVLLLSPQQSLAKSVIPASCVKYKQSMDRACIRRKGSCSKLTKSLNVCLKKATTKKVSTPLPVTGVVCTMIFAPVCGELSSGVFQEFSNSCFASAAGASVVDSSKCSLK